MLPRLDPDDLIASRTDAWRVLLGVALWVSGVIGLLAAGATGSVWPLLATAPAMIGVLLIIDLGRRVSRRLRPNPIGRIDRWTLDSKVGQQWLRPSVLRHAIKLARGAD